MVDDRLILALAFLEDLGCIETNFAIQKMWKDFWEKTKTEVDRILQLGGYRLSYYQDMFGFTLELTTDRRKYAEFEPQRNSILFNALILLTEPPYWIASTLVHEGDHQEFCRAHNMLFKPPEETVIFHGKHHKEMELRALKRELSFLEITRPLINPSWEIYFYSRKKVSHIDDHIQSRKLSISQLEKYNNRALEYEKGRVSGAIEETSKIMLELGFEPPTEDSPIVTYVTVPF